MLGAGHVIEHYEALKGISDPEIQISELRTRARRALAAFLVPVFFLGKAYLGRVMGIFLLLVYAGYAVLRVTYIGQ